jgi:ketosteroid isomerase-like protein
MKNLMAYAIVLFLFCTSASEKDIKKLRITKLSEKLTLAEQEDDLESFLSFYHKNAISMPEYQLLLQGEKEIKSFYKEIFQRQVIKTYKRTPHELIDQGKTIIEIGTFTKQFSNVGVDSVLTQQGKYMNVWEEGEKGEIKLKGEAFGYFHPIEKQELLVAELGKEKFESRNSSLDSELPFELMAYNALMEKQVQTRDGNSRSRFYSTNAMIMPFQEPNVTGNEKIKAYLIEYSKRGSVSIDSVAIYTYHYENLKDYKLEYFKFRVQLHSGTYVGKVAGKGIRLWKRVEDGSLRMYREIGTHNKID